MTGAPGNQVSQPRSIQLNWGNVLGLWTFLTLGNIKFDLLAFGQSFETRTSDITEMGENVGTGFLLNKTKAFGFVEPFNGTCCGSRHMKILLN